MLDVEVMAAYRVWSQQQAKDPGPLAAFGAGWDAALTWIDALAAELLPDGAVARAHLSVVRLGVQAKGEGE